MHPILLNLHDSVIFQSTDLWNQIKKQEYLPKIGQKVGSLLVPPLILGDAAFPLQPWLMKPCTNANPTLQQRYVTSRAKTYTNGFPLNGWSRWVPVGYPLKTLGIEKTVGIFPLPVEGVEKSRWKNCSKALQAFEKAVGFFSLTRWRPWEKPLEKNNDWVLNRWKPWEKPF